LVNKYLKNSQVFTNTISKWPQIFWYLGKGKSNLERQKVLFWYLGKGKSNFERQKVLFCYLGKGKSNFERQKVLFWYLGKGKSCFIIFKNAFVLIFKDNEIGVRFFQISDQHTEVVRSLQKMRLKVDVFSSSKFEDFLRINPELSYPGIKRSFIQANGSETRIMNTL
jgi:hypothetical protein